MKVFSLYLKIVRQNMVSVLVYLIFFLLIFGLITGQVKKQNTHGEVPMGTLNLAVFDHDQSLLSQNLVSYLRNHASSVDIPEDEEIFQDLLYSRQVDYILLIPEGFSANLGKDARTLNLKTYTSSQTTGIEYLDGLIESYIANWDLILWTFGGELKPEDTDLALSRLNQILNSKVPSSLVSGKEVSALIGLQYFLASMNYVIIALAANVIGMPLVSIEDNKMKMRDLAAGYPESKRAGQTFLAAYLTLSVIWLIFVFFSFIRLGWNLLSDPAVPYMLASSFLHMLAIASLILFLVHLFPSKAAVSFISTILSLLISFSSGIFVPAEFLWPPFHKFSMIFPTYWDVQNQFKLSGIMAGARSLRPYYRNLAIILGMMALFFSFTLVQRRFKAKSKSELE